MLGRMRMSLPWLAVLATLLLSGCGYNELQRADEQVNAAWSEVLNQYQRRADLVPNLVETVKAFAAHERELMESVAKARVGTMAAGAGWQAQEHLHQALGTLIARAEAYPQLKSDRNFVMLQRQLAECEAQIAAARRAYNASIMDYHNSIEMVPSSIVAGAFGFRHLPAFEIAVAERSNPHVRF